MVDNWFEPITTLGKLQQKSWTPRRPESDSAPRAQAPRLHAQAPRIMPRRPDLASDLPRCEQTKPSIRIQCPGAQNSRQAPVLKYRRGKPDLAPEAHKTHAQALVFDAQA
ncbi:hypothetical protein PIB30_011775 [Stylosanthes scabra]|uniref:Uncharacterized protein n=1 Tax=Stylosanthes scabra TaxID=79078 RepID=A0ABU6Q5U0_9FABA|nr:hypothetical protein [Stylosanthes scabra]